MDLGDLGAVDPLSDSMYGSLDPSFAAPFEGGDVGSADVLTQTIPQNTVQLGSDTIITPTTAVLPQLIYRPGIEIHSPVVHDFQAYDRYPGGYGYDGYYGGLHGDHYGSPYAYGGDYSGNYSSDYGNDYGIDYCGGYGSDYSGDYGGDYGGDYNSDYTGGFMSDPFSSGLQKRQLRPASRPSRSGPAFGNRPSDASCPSGIAGCPSGISKDTLIQPIVSIQPYASAPVPVPVSEPYDYPVPVGVSVPWCDSDCNSCGGHGSDCGFKNCNGFGGGQSCNWGNWDNWGC
ncbi:hypothetical protein BGZ70_006567 [Mortierella alpina]|uniref:Uncharacterized protein n=1 Tax=Mortierella alpina TaxID=64518 RepID=A0A9P6M3V6_MORAP|nr:hypothetical protein BGZ70_006567 [Mortierella alpina]